MICRQSKALLPRFCLAAAVGALTALAASQAVCADFPAKPITLVVPASAGGGQDTQARAMASVIEPLLGQPLQVVNKPGAAHYIGAKFVADSRPDGYTLMSDNAGTLILADLAKPQVVDVFKDFELVAMIGELYTALAVRSDDKRFSSMATFVAYAKQHPEVTYGMAGKGSFHHIAALGIEDVLGYTARAVPFAGGSNVRAALLGGQIDFAWIGIQQLSGFEEKLTALAVASEERDPVMSAYPTFKELGIPYTLVTGPSVVFAPKGTPAEIVELLGNAIKKGIMSDKYTKVVEKQGMVPVYRNAADTKAYLQGLAAKWKPLVAKVVN